MTKIETTFSYRMIDRTRLIGNDNGVHDGILKVSFQVGYRHVVVVSSVFLSALGASHHREDLAKIPRWLVVDGSGRLLLGQK